ncbi:hypothetical protein [Streptomyces sp. NBC_01477]|uniref:hypothetical protein n=1 Tax=Streptomyces sp. NBC_01477 TaxID=2976015 RepID=UPI002E354CC8|nr:hypothetical protein [Streptomyces sp. NBC_01477]
MLRHVLSTLAASVLVLFVPAAPAPAYAAPTAAPAAGSTPAADPTGCTTWFQWVQTSSPAYLGTGVVQCTAGRYRAKVVCNNAQTGQRHVVYGTQTVNAPASTTATCGSPDEAVTAYPVTDPPGTGVTGCASWTEWVHQGSSAYLGNGLIQCDTGRYRAKAVCRNLQTGVGYVVYSTQVVSAPALTSVTCNTGNSAETVQAVADPPGTGVTGCASWTEWIHSSTNNYLGQGYVQCDTGTYAAAVTCRYPTGQTYVVYGYAATAPNPSGAACYVPNEAVSIAAAPR